jgi:hypothetical protein
MSSTGRITLLAVAAAALLDCPLRADFITIPQPTDAYVNATTRLIFTDSDGTIIGGSTASGETAIYSSNLVEYTVPTTWTSWATPPAVETSTPRVGFTDGVSSLAISLSQPVKIFGFELEPDNLASEQTTAAFYSGSTLVGTIDLSPDGNAGALLYAASTHTDPFTRVVITNLEGDDFAIAQERFVLAVPEPATLILLIPLLAAFAALRRSSAEL